MAMAMAMAACSGGSSDGASRAAAPATRADSGPVTAPPTTKAPPGQERRSEPYWVPVTDLKGTGPSTTEAFTIVGNALQWRGTYHCQTAPFSALPVKESGEPLRRPLADAAACGAEGKGFVSEAGRFTIKIDTRGTWDIKVEQQVDTPLVEPLTTALAEALPAATATVHGVDKEGEGTAKLFRLPDGTKVIRLEDFSTTINSDLELRLSPLADPRTTNDIAAAPFVTVAPLKATIGSMNYTVPADVDLSQYHSIVIWCEITRNAYAAASLEQG
jgi:hypothetical protein